MSERQNDVLNDKPETKERLALWVEGFLGLKLHASCRCKPESPNEALQWAAEGKQPHNSQLDYVWDGFTNKYAASVLMACRGAGKSFAAAAMDILDAWFKPGIKIANAAFIRQQADYIYQYTKAFLKHMEEQIGEVQWKISTDEIIFFNGSVIKYFSGGKSSANVTGYHPHILRVDEADKFSAEQFDGIANGLESQQGFPSRFDVLSTNYSLSGDGVILKQIERYEAFNKTKPDALLPRNVYRICLIDILAKCDDRFTCSNCHLWKYCKGRAKQQDGFIDVGEAIGKMLNSSLQTFESQMLLLRPSSEYAIFGGFSVASHVLDPEVSFNPQHDTFLPFDFGGKRCPHASLLIQRVPPKTKDEATVYSVIDEFQGWGLLENMIAEIKMKYPEASAVAQVFADPAGNRKEMTAGAISYIGALRKAGFFPTNRPVKRKASFEQLKAKIEPASGPPTLFVNKRCKNLIAQIQAAEYESKGGKPTGEPADSGKDDLLDCLRYTIAASWGTFAKHSGAKQLRFF